MDEPRQRNRALPVDYAWDFLSRLRTGDEMYFAAGQTTDFTIKSEPCEVTNVNRDDLKSSTTITVSVRTHHGGNYKLEVDDTADRTYAYRDGAGGLDSCGEVRELEFGTLRYGNN